MEEPGASAVFQNAQVHLEEPVNWPEGTRLSVVPILPLENNEPLRGQVIIVGFGLAGRCVSDLLDRIGSPFTIIEKNAVTVETQLALGRNIVQGDATDPVVLASAGLSGASILALTMPDEAAVLRATSLARRLNPKVYIIARTNYSSQGMKASQLGADEVIKAEQAVALQFYDRLARRLRRPTKAGV